VKVVYSPTHRVHDPQTDVEAGRAVPHVERAARAELILERLSKDESFRVQAPTDHGLSPIQAVHAKGLIEFLSEASQAAQTIPDTILHPSLREGMDQACTEPVDPTARLGYWCFDTGTPITRRVFEAARAAVDVALSAAELVLAGEPMVYGLCRPPGHHAARSVFGGFCYFNNAAVSAEYVARRTGERVAVLDLDYHHGNGTQQIFYQRADVLFASLHGDPLRAYPYFVGHVGETGAGAGVGATLNIPLPAGTGDDQYLDALDVALDRVVAFAPSLTIVSLGVDTYVDDPLGDFALTTAGYRAIGALVGRALKRFVVLQEGGYYLPDIGENVYQFLRGLA
jgi:acetoin utilization deacetylase AcuC-like enzyme